MSLFNPTPQLRAQALLSQARLMQRASFEAAARTLAPSLEDPLLLVALARRLLGPREALSRVHAALEEADRERVAGGVEALGACLEGAARRDEADRAFAEVEGELRALVVLLYLCVDLSDEHEQDVLEAYADGIAAHEEPPLSALRLGLLREALFSRARLDTGAS